MMTTKDQSGVGEGRTSQDEREAPRQVSVRCWHTAIWVVDLRSGRVMRETCAECREEAATVEGGWEGSW